MNLELPELYAVKVVRTVLKGESGSNAVYLLIKQFVMDKHMNRTKEVLEKRGIKQTWLAEKLGKSFCIVKSAVCNSRQPSLEVLFLIARILQMDVKYLVNYSNND